jgi:hypothetical protein
MRGNDPVEGMSAVGWPGTEFAEGRVEEARGGRER